MSLVLIGAAMTGRLKNTTMPTANKARFVFVFASDLIGASSSKPWSPFSTVGVSSE
jgi:hypothetical protein